MTTWTAEERRTFLSHVAEDRLAPMWTLYATTGRRRGEVLGLRWQDVDLERGQLTVRHVLTVDDGRPLVTEPKTAKGRRTIALDATTVAALRRHRLRQLEERVAASVAWRDGDYVFAWPNGRPIHPQTPTKWIRVHATAAGLPPIRLPDLRHGWATLALGAGVPAKVVFKRLGHADISITLDVDTHALRAMDAEAADNVARAISGVSCHVRCHGGVTQRGRSALLGGGKRSARLSGGWGAGDRTLDSDSKGRRVAGYTTPHRW